MILMHGLFDLKDNVEEEEFRQSFDEFSEHLRVSELVLSYRFMREQAHDGYNADPPSTRHYVAVEFVSMEHAQRCWDYIQDNEESIKSLHAAVFTKIQHSRFFLTSDV